jgi:hypothetical protein
MLVEGLQTAHAWWVSWAACILAPKIDSCTRTDGSLTPRAQAGLLSIWRRGWPSYAHATDGYTVRVIRLTSMRRFLFTASTSERLRDPESERLNGVRHLQPVAAEAGTADPSIPICATCPPKPGFWANRHNGARLAAVGHAATLGPAYFSSAAPIT